MREFKAYIKKDHDILKVLMSYGVAQADDLGTDLGGSGDGVPVIDEDLEGEINPKGLECTEKRQKVKDGDEFAEEIEEGDQFMAVKPWMGVVRNSVPDGFKPSKRDGVAPDATLELEYVHGYRCHDSRNNLRYTSGGKLAYITAGVAVVMDGARNTQKHFMDHSDDIHCIAMHPGGRICATGQIGPKPRICIWDNETMECKVLITAPLTKGVKHMAFSPDGKYLIASAMDDDQMVAVFEWEKPPVKPGKPIAPIAHGKSTRAKILSIGFTGGNTAVATCVKEVCFMTFANGAIKSQKGTGWGNKGPEAVLTQAMVGNSFFTGALSGDIIQWNGRNLAKRTKAHTGRVNAMFAVGQTLVSGGADGKVNLW